MREGAPKRRRKDDIGVMEGLMGAMGKSSDVEAAKSAERQSRTALAQLVHADMKERRVDFRTALAKVFPTDSWRKAPIPAQEEDS